MNKARPLSEGKAVRGDEPQGSASETGAGDLRLPERWFRNGVAWLSDGGSKGHLVSIGHMLTGNMGNAVLMLVGTSLAARALGPAAYGIFAMVLTIGRLSERLIRFESWQPLIKFIADEEVSGDAHRKARLFLYGLLLDVSCSLLAAALSVLAGYLLLDVLNLRSEHMASIAVYALALALNIRGVPTAALRLAGKFRTLAYVQMGSSLLRIGLACLAMVEGADLLDFIIIWTVAQTLDQLIYLGLGFKALGSMEVPNPVKVPVRGLAKDFPGFLQYAWTTNISSTLRTMTQEADTLLVGALAGSAAAGFYHIAKRIAKVASQVGAQVQAVLYPDMARLWARHDFAGFQRLTARIQLVLGGIGLAILAATGLVGEFAIGTVFGGDYRASFPMLMAQLVAVMLMMHSAPSRSALLAMNRPRFVLVVDLFGTAAFFLVAFLAIPYFAALGANFAHIAFALLSAAAMDVAWWRQARAVQRIPTAPG